jgi:hypothetical protein
MIGYAVLGIIGLWLLYMLVIRPRREAQRYAKSRLIRRRGSHSYTCGCRECTKDE